MGGAVRLFFIHSTLFCKGYKPSDLTIRAHTIVITIQ